MKESTDQILAKIAEKLGVAAEQLWGAMVRQAFISAIMHVIVLTIAFGLLVWGWRAAKTADFDLSDSILVRIGLCAGLAMWFIVLTYNGADIVAGFVNPEFWALDRILRQLR